MNFHHFFSAGIIAPGNMTKALKNETMILLDVIALDFKTLYYALLGGLRSKHYLCYMFFKIPIKKPLLYNVLYLPIYYHALLTTYVFLLNKVFLQPQIDVKFYKLASCKEIKAFSYLITTPYPFLYSPLLRTDYFNTSIIK